MKGDRVEIRIDTGGGMLSETITATKAGRKVEIEGPTRGVLSVNELTRTDQIVRTARFMASRVISAVEHPAEPPKPIRVIKTGLGEVSDA